MSNESNEGDEMLTGQLSHAVERWRAIPATDGRDARGREALATRLAGLPAPRRRRSLHLYGWRVAAAAALAAALVLAVIRDPATRGAVDESRTPDLATSATPVIFSLEAKGARAVSLVGDFNGWSEHGVALARSGNRWSVTLPLPAGRYAYTFRVDDRWVADELAARAPGDFGPPTSILIVSNGSTR